MFQAKINGELCHAADTGWGGGGRIPRPAAVIHRAYGCLQALPADDWASIDYGRFLSDPQGEALRLSAWAGWPWDRELGAQLPLSRYTLSQPDPDKWRRHAAEIEPRLAQWRATVDRAARAAGL